MTTYCSHPGCYNSDDDGTLYKEETTHNTKGWMAVCGRHLSREKCEDGRVTVLMSDEPEAADAANAAVLRGLEDSE
jgi:hypothetical protein